MRRFSAWRAALVVAALVASCWCAPAAGEEFYDRGSGVLSLGVKDFDETVSKAGTVTLVEFYAPWCGHCKSLKPEWIKAAKQLAGVVQVAAVDADNEANRPLAGKYGVKGFPTIKAFVAGQKKPVDYNGERSAGAIVSFAKGLLPSRVRTLSSKDADKWLEEGAALPRVLLFTDKTETSALYKALSVRFEGHAAFGQVNKKEKALVSRFEVARFPTLLVLPAGASAGAHVVYGGSFTPKAVGKWLRRFAAGAPGGDEDYLPQLHDQSCVEKHCLGGSSSMCAVLVLDSADNAAMDALIEARDKREDSLYSFVWVDQAAQAGWLKETFGVEPQEYPQLLAFSARKKRFAQYVGVVSQEGASTFLDQVLRGKVKTLPLASGAGDLPRLAGETEKCKEPAKPAKAAKAQPQQQQQQKPSSGGGAESDPGRPVPPPGSVPLTAASFDEMVLKSRQPWMVEFFAPWCGHCQRLAPEWAKAADRAGGQVRFGAVNCDEEQRLCSRFKVEGFPTIKSFKPGAGERGAADYQGDRSARALYDYALEMVPTNLVPVLDEKTFKAWAEKGPGHKVVLMISEQPRPAKTTNALSMEFGDRLRFAHIRSTSADLVKQLGVTKFPTLLAVDLSAGAGQIFQGPMVYPALAEFCREVASADLAAAAAAGKAGAAAGGAAAKPAEEEAAPSAECADGVCEASA